MKILRYVALVAAVALALSGLAFTAGQALKADNTTRSSTINDPGSDRSPDKPNKPRRTPNADPSTPEAPPPPPETSKPAPPAPPKPELTPGPRLMGPGDESEEVKDLQARLRQIDWFEADVTGFYGDVTETAVSGFQAKREIPVTGEVDQRTMDRLLAMTHEPTIEELENRLESNVPGALDSRCTTGRVLCIDKTSRTLRWVVDGQVEKTLDVRFGSEYTPTREGTFSVYVKDIDRVSNLYGSSMPFSMFFSGGQAVHYSSDFNAVGYNGASHGCVNVRDYAGIEWLYGQVEVGDKVVVYRS